MKNLKEYLNQYDNGNEVETVEMGGIVIGYEIAIQDLAIEIMRELADKELPEDKDEFRKIVNDAEKIAVDKLDSKHGFSGAQVGAAKNLVGVFWRQSPEKGLAMMREQDPARIIKIKKGKTETDPLELIGSKLMQPNITENKKTKKVTEKELLDAIDNYKEQLYRSDKVSATKFDHMQHALYGCKCIVRKLFGSEQVQEDGWVK